MMRATGLTVAVLVFAVTTVVGTWVSHAAMPEKPDLTTEGPWKDSTLRIEFSNRIRGEFVNWFDAGSSTNARYDFLANRFQAGIRLMHPNLEAFFQLQHSLLDNIPDGGGGGPGGVYWANTKDTFQQAAIFRQGWIKAKTHLDNDTISITFGRTRFADGTETTPNDPALRWVKSKRIAQRLIGPFDYSHVGRSFDGVKLSFDRGAVNVTGFWHRPTSGGFEISGGRHLNDINLLGASVTSNREIAGSPTDARLFWIFYGDDRDVLRLDNRPLSLRSADTKNTSINTIGANFLHVVPVGDGKTDFLAWAAGQTGDWQSQGHSAWAYALEIGYQLPDVAMSPWVRVGFFQGSGDDDPSDGNHETFFQMLPTARLYAMTPFFNMMNNQDTFIQLLLKPAKQLAVRADFHWLRVTEHRDYAYFGAGASKDDFFGFGGVPANGKRDLGFLSDLGITWKPCEVFKIYAYYGHLFGRSVQRSAFPVNEDLDYGFIEGTLSF